MGNFFYKLLKHEKQSSLVDEDLIELADTRPCTRLPPKKVRLRDWDLVRGQQGICLIGLMCIAGACGGYGGQGFRHFRDMTTDSSVNPQCDLYTSQNTLERNFMIDIRLGDGLSFAQAKLVDVAWDLFIGQGGRFLHGWVLYQYVIVNALVCVMETTTVPYHFYTNLVFSTVSWPSLWSLGRRLASFPGIRAFASALWMVFAIAYTLGFPTLWSAATGYLKPTTAVYSAPDSSLLSLNSDLLTTCWSASDDRGLNTDGEVYLGIGTSYATYRNNNDLMLRLPTALSDVNDVLANFTKYPGVPQDFLNLYEYAIVRNFLAQALHTADVQYNGSIVESSMSYTPDNLELVWPSDSTSIPRTVHVELYNRGYQANVNVTFIASDTVGQGMNVLPYNSTLRINATNHQLEAPFKSLGAECHQVTSPAYPPSESHDTVGGYSSLLGVGACACVYGRPITTDFFASENVQCIGATGYIWGFSSTLLLVGLVLETVWLCGCCAMWMYTYENSQLLQHGRRATGTIRSVLDLAEAINYALGDATCVYTNDELEKALEVCEPIGFSMEEREEGVKHIGLVGARDQRKVVMNQTDLYGKAGVSPQCRLRKSPQQYLDAADVPATNIDLG